MVTKQAEAVLTRKIKHLAGRNYGELLKVLEGDGKLALFCMERKELRMLEDVSGRILSQELVRISEKAALMAVENSEIAYETNQISKKLGWPVLFSALKYWDSVRMALLKHPELATMINEVNGRMAVFEAAASEPVAREVARNYKHYLALRNGFTEKSLREHIKTLHGTNFFRGVPSDIVDEAVRGLKESARLL